MRPSKKDPVVEAFDDLEEFDEDAEDYEEYGSRPVSHARRRKKKKRKVSKWKAKDVGQIALRLGGYLAALHGLVGVIITLPALMMSVLLGNLILGAISLVFACLMWMGMNGAIGRGVALSRESRIEGNAGIILGICLIEGTSLVVALALGALAHQMNPKGIKPVVIWNPAPGTPQVATTTPSMSAGGGSTVGNAHAVSGQAASSQRYVDSTRGCSFIAPTGWTVQPKADPVDLVIMGPNSNGFQNNARIFVQNAPISLEAFASGSVAELRKTTPSAQILSQTDFQTVDGVRGIKVVVEGAALQVKIRYMIYLIENQAMKYTLMTGTLPTNAAEFSEAMDACAKSFRIEGSAAASQAPASTPQTQPQSNSRPQPQSQVPSHAQPPSPTLMRVQPQVSASTQPQSMTQSNNDSRSSPQGQAQTPQRGRPAEPVRTYQFSIVIKSYSGTGDVLSAAKRAFASEPGVDQQSIKYDQDSKTMTLVMQMTTISTAPVQDGLKKAGFQIGETSMRAVKK